MKMNLFATNTAYAIALSSALALSANGALASPAHGSGKIANGEPGKASEVSKTIEVEMHDNYYSLESIDVKKGQTVRFLVKNMGEFVHEFNIGTPDQHVAHQPEMLMMIEHGILEADKINRGMMSMDMGGGKTMEHNDPNSVLLEPGETKEVVWLFSDSGTLEYACNVPGHYDAGMVGQINFK